MASDGDSLYFGTGGDAIGYGAESTGVANIYKYDGKNEPILISNEDEFGAGVQVLYIFNPPALTITARSPIDINLIDPDGFIMNKNVSEIGDATYTEIDLDGDGNLDDKIQISYPKLGSYLTQVVPEPDALPTDTYSLAVIANGQTIVLAENVPISEIPDKPYITRLTETGIIPVIPALVDFDPDTLNLKSKGQWVTVYIELPVGYAINDIVLQSIRLNNQLLIEPKPIEIGDYNSNGISDLMVKFSRSAVQNILGVGDKVFPPH